MLLLIFSLPQFLSSEGIVSNDLWKSVRDQCRNLLKLTVNTLVPTEQTVDFKYDGGNIFVKRFPDPDKASVLVCCLFVHLMFERVGSETKRTIENWKVTDNYGP